LGRASPVNPPPQRATADVISVVDSVILTLVLNLLL
jgi:hypothetical protein